MDLKGLESFTEKDNQPPEEQELNGLRKRNKQLGMEADIFEANRKGLGTKINVIEQNRYRYSVSATFLHRVIRCHICKVLQIARRTFYHDTGIAAQKEQEKLAVEQGLKEKIQVIFHDNREVYGTRRIKDALQKADQTVSRRWIGRLMAELGITSKYTQASYKPISIHQMKSL